MTARNDYPLLDAVLKAGVLLGEQPDAFDRELMAALDEIDSLRKGLYDMAGWVVRDGKP